jgi:hypothetical protein
MKKAKYKKALKKLIELRPSGGGRFIRKARKVKIMAKTNEKFYF